MDPRFLEAFSAAVPGHYESVLDLGARNGSKARLVSADRRLGVERDGSTIDLDTEPRVSYVVGDMHDYVANAADDSFDVVLLLAVLEWCARDQGFDLLRNAKRVTRRRVVAWLSERGVPKEGRISCWVAEDLRQMGFAVNRLVGIHEDPDGSIHDGLMAVYVK